MPVGRRWCVAGAVLSAAVMSSVLGPTAAVGAARTEPSAEVTQESPATEQPVLTETDALAQAERTGESVEIASQRGESSEVFATPDGKLEAREYLRPVWTRVDGEWKAVDTDLTKIGDGMVAPKAATIGLQFSGGGGAPMVRMEKAGRQLELSWPGELPAPRLDGDIATYADVLPGVDLRLGAQEDGFSQLLVVKSAEAAASKELAEVRLRMDTQGLNVQETSSGGLEALDEGAGTAVFEAPEPVMWDSSPGAAASGAAVQKSGAEQMSRAAAAETTAAADENGEPGATESGKLAPVSVDVPAAQDELVLKPDTDVLRGDDTVYPVSSTRRCTPPERRHGRWRRSTGLRRPSGSSTANPPRAWATAPGRTASPMTPSGSSTAFPSRSSPARRSSPPSSRCGTPGRLPAAREVSSCGGPVTSRSPRHGTRRTVPASGSTT